MVLELFKNPLDTHFSKLHRDIQKATFLYDVVGLSNEAVDIMPAKCQRDLCWSEKQYQSYVQHVFETRDAGNFIVYRDNESHKVYVVDGQHRREAFLRFMRGGFKVLDNTVSWSDFTADEITRLKLALTASVTLIQGNGYPDKAIEEMYNRFNFSGVSHT